MDFSGFFSPIFSDPSSAESVRILVLLIGGFVVGTITGLIIGRSLSAKWRRLLKKDREAAESLQSRYSSLNEEFELQRADLQKAENQLQDAENRNAEYSKENKQLATDLDNASKKLEHMDARITADSALMEDLRHQIIGLKARLKELTGGTSEVATSSEETIARLGERMTQLERKIPELEELIRKSPNNSR